MSLKSQLESALDAGDPFFGEKLEPAVPEEILRREFLFRYLLDDHVVGGQGLGNSALQAVRAEYEAREYAERLTRGELHLLDTLPMDMHVGAAGVIIGYILQDKEDALAQAATLHALLDKGFSAKATHGIYSQGRASVVEADPFRHCHIDYTVDKPSTYLAKPDVAGMPSREMNIRFHDDLFPTAKILRPSVRELQSLSGVGAVFVFPYGDSDLEIPLPVPDLSALDAEALKGISGDSVRKICDAYLAEKRYPTLDHAALSDAFQDAVRGHLQRKDFGTYRSVSFLSGEGKPLVGVSMGDGDYVKSIDDIRIGNAAELGTVRTVLARLL